MLAHALPPTIRRLILLSACLLMTSGLLHSSFANPVDAPATAGANAGKDLHKDLQRQALLAADQLTYDQQNKKIVAEGGVEIERDGRVLQADRVSYDQTNRVLTAEGHVKLIDVSGDVAFADKMVMDDQFREGFAEEVRLLLADNSRMAARRADRSDGNLSNLHRVTFSPCKVCEDPNQAPFWQLKADRVTHNQQDKMLVYHDVRLEFYGLPVFYSPYFSYPDPSVKKKSGLLSPSYLKSSQNGNGVSIPYFWNIAPERDLTLQPVVYDKAGNLLKLQYRERFRRGIVDVQGSGGYLDRVLDDGQTSNTGRGHIKAMGRYDYDENWRFGADIQKASDRSYMTRYDIDKNLLLQNRLYAEGFYGRDYANVSLYKFDDLRQSVDPELSPRALPVASYEHYSPRLGGGSLLSNSYLKWTPSTAILQRDVGVNTQRLSSKAEWVIPELIANNGTRLRLNALIQSDLYKVQEPNTTNGSRDIGRLVPIASAKLDRPLVSPGQDFTQTINPLVQVTATPNTKANSKKIPNEDSQSFELDETNLLSTNRFPGLDRLSTGNRVDYGVSHEIKNRRDQHIRTFVGQSFEPNAKDVYGVDTGAGQSLSDVVGGTTIGLSKNTEVAYRFRRDSESLKSRRDEVGFTTQIKPVTLSASYVALNPKSATNTNLIPQEQVIGSVGVNLGDGWNLTTSSSRDLRTGQTRNFGGALTYGNECTNLSATFTHDFTSNSVDNKPGTSLLLQLNLKYLGDVGDSNLSF
jgi:LPS-assembly protein